jgi:PqqD family protein of HPr-rel-A system
MTMSSATPLRRVSTLPYQKLNDEVLVVDTKTREVHLLNATATRIWDLLETPRTPDELLACLTEEFDASPDQLRADLETLLGELASKGLVGSDSELSGAHPAGAGRRSPTLS